MQKLYLTPAQLAERYGGTIKVRTLANWRSRREGPEYIKVGGRVLYPLDELLAWEVRRTLLKAA